MISLFLFLTVSFITSTLVSRLQLHVGISQYNEHQAHLLYKISLGYLNISGISNIFDYAVKNLNEIVPYPAMIYPANGLSELKRPYCEDSLLTNDMPKNNTIALWCLTNVLPCGFGTTYFPTSAWKYIPVKSSDNVLGVAAFLCKKSDLSKENMIIIETLLSQMALTIERENMHNTQDAIRMEMEKEQLQGNILQSIFHDLKTPLSQIADSSNFIMKDYDQLDKKTVLNLLSKIHIHANRLNQLAENLRNTIQLDEGKIQLSKQEELLSDIVDEAFHRVENSKKNHHLSLHIQEKTMTLSLDKKLMLQVLLNLLNNAILHTNSTADITVSIYRENNYIVFSIEDNGGGIEEELLDKLFDPFVTTSRKDANSPQGIGLGLSICKSIVEAHGGTILAFNNEQGGATFRFMLPFKNQNYYEKLQIGD